jgi:hypothetical protein
LDKADELKVGPGGVVQKQPLVIPKGISAEAFLRASKAKALMRTTVTEGGTVLVDCPYCIIFWRRKTPVDITKFIDRDGKREVTAYCPKGHKLVFRSIHQWREERQKMGLQARA